MTSVSLLGLPERKRNYRFALTPLADAMFQLLIFFMLSSNLTPYSLLTLQSAALPEAPASSTPGANAETDAPPDTGARPADAGEVVLWTLERGSIRVAGQSFGFDALERLADALGATGEGTEVLLIVRPSATVQDISTVIARLQLADLTSVQIASGGGE